jgi:hypothetical protein
MAEDKRKAELIAELARSRSRLSTNFAGLRSDLDFPAKARRAFSQNPAIWIGGAALFGLAFSRWLGRPKKVVVDRRGKTAPLAKAGKAGFMLGMLKIAFDLTRPALTGWLTQRVADYLAASHPRDRRSRP